MPMSHHPDRHWAIVRVRCLSSIHKRLSNFYYYYDNYLSTTVTFSAGVIAITIIYAECPTS